MRRFAIVALCACGRFGFDDVTPRANGSGDTDGGGSNRPMADAFIRGDVSFTNNIAFVTNAVVMPATLGSASKGDELCQAAADAAGLPGTYVAWLSTSTSNAIDRIAGSRGWVRADGLPYFDRPEDLIGGRVFSPLAVDADGVQLASSFSVMTGTRPNGTAGMSCNGLTDSAAMIDQGTSTTVTADWTWYSYSWHTCSQPGRLYCLGTGNTNPVVVEQVPSRRAFLSATSWQPGSGIASADAVCQSDAAAAGLSNPTVFRALLATSTASAASRFTDGLPWARIDGMLVANTAQDLFAGNYRVPLNVRADGSHTTATGSGAVAWLGAPKPDVVGTETCSNWSVSNNGTIGHSLNHVRLYPTTSNYGCNYMNPLFCLEP